MNITIIGTGFIGKPQCMLLGSNIYPDSFGVTLKPSWTSNRFSHFSTLGYRISRGSLKNEN